MPRHDHWCRPCGRRFETTTAEPSWCPVCGSTNTHWLPQIATGGFEKFWSPHLDHEPVEITSAQHLDRELKARGKHIQMAPKREKYQRLPKSAEEAKHRF